MPPKPSLKNWLKHTLHAKITLVLFMVVFGSIGVYTLRQSFAAVPESVYSNPSGVTFNVTVIYSDGSEQNVGNRTTPVDLNSGGQFYRLTFLSAPSGYTFRQWRTAAFTSASNPVTFSTNNDQTINIDLNAPTPAPTVSLAPSSGNVNQNSSLSLYWSSTNATNCNASGNWSGGKAASGSESRDGDTASAGTKSYYLFCSGPGGSASASASVNVQQVTPAPTVSINAYGATGSSTVTQNSQLTVNWSSTNATSCNATGTWSGGKGTSGPESRNGDTATTGTKQYTLTCQGPGGSGSSTAYANVQSAPVPEYSTPGAPGSPRVTSKNTSTINLAWNASSLSGGGSVNYKVYRRASQTATTFQSITNVGGATSFGSTGLSSSTTYYYSICAFNTLKPGAENCSFVNGVTDAVAGAPAPPAPPAAPPPTSRPTTAGSGGTTSGNPLQGSSNFVPTPGSGADTTPPATPIEFRAIAEENSFIVGVSWQAGGEQSDVAAYALERSEDQTNWFSLSDNITDLSFSDEDTRFNTKYYYRIKAYDAAGNASPYALADVTSGAFVGNVTKAEGGIITADGVSVEFPVDAVTEDLNCAVQEKLELASDVKNYDLVMGPYEIICKNAASETVTGFSKALTVNITPSEQQQKRYKDFRYFATQDDGWVEVHAGLGSFELENTNVFGLFGKAKSTPIWIKILLWLLAILVLGAGVVGVLYLRYRRQQQEALDDYWHKMNGV